MLKYIKIAQLIKEDIQKKEVPQGTKLPNINQLSKEYNASKNTILKALATLESNGLIYQVQGSGIFVRQKKRKGYFNLLENKGFSSDLPYSEVGTKLISFSKEKPTLEVTTNLNCNANEEVYVIKRLHTIMDQPICLEESYYKISIVNYLSKELCEGSIFNYLKQALKIDIGFSDKYISVDKTDESISHYFGIPLSSPLLTIEEIYYTTNGEPFDFSKNYYHYEHTQFFLQS